jgi:hypothetical protein
LGWEPPELWIRGGAEAEERGGAEARDERGARVRGGAGGDRFKGGRGGIRGAGQRSRGRVTAGRAGDLGRAVARPLCRGRKRRGGTER